MLIVAGVHFRLSYVDGLLTPWRGGGFGMFATVDSAANRTLRIELSTTGGVRRAAPVVPLDGVTARSFPSTAHLVRLARDVLLRHCVAGPDWVRVTVSKVVFDRDSGVTRDLPVKTLTLRERPPCSEW